MHPRLRTLDSAPLLPRTIKPTIRNIRTMTTPAKLTDWVLPTSSTGAFNRQTSTFRASISASSPFPPAAKRYHLFVSYACPWAHRTLITLHLKSLTDLISHSAVHWHLADGGWHFSTPEEASNDPAIPTAPEPVAGAKYLSELYYKSNPDYEGRYTVPVLWDKETKFIVNNESSEIIRFLYSEFDSLLPSSQQGKTFYPSHLAQEIDDLNTWIYDTINNGVYKAGFATKQAAYEEAVTKVFEGLDKVEKLLKNSKGRYLLGEELTEADIRLYPTIVRFDVVYVQHFKCNIRMIRHDYPAIHRWLRHLYWDIPAFAKTTNFEHIKKHYTVSHKQINPFGIVPVGPVPDIMPKDE